MKAIEFQLLGATTFWNLAASSDFQRICNGMEAIGITKGPNQKTPFAAVGQAARAAFGKGDYIFRSLDKNVGVLVVKETTGREDNEFESICRIMVDQERDSIGEIIFLTNIEGGLQEEYRLKDVIREMFELFMEQIDAPMLGSYLSKMVQTVGGTTLRQSGGVYYIPETGLERWQEIVQVIEGAAINGKSEVTNMEFRKTESAIRGIHAAIRDEIKARCDEIRLELADDLGKKARVRRQVELKTMQDKVREYEDIANHQMTDLTDLISEVQHVAAMETMAASAAQLQLFQTSAA